MIYGLPGIGTLIMKQADYGHDVPDIGYRYRIWQYTSTASVPGIAGGCDVNIAYGTR